MGQCNIHHEPGPPAAVVVLLSPAFLPDCSWGWEEEPPETGNQDCRRMQSFPATRPFRATMPLQVRSPSLRFDQFPFSTRPGHMHNIEHKFRESGQRSRSTKVSDPHIKRRSSSAGHARRAMLRTQLSKPSTVDRNTRQAGSNRARRPTVHDRTRHTSLIRRRLASQCPHKAEVRKHTVQKEGRATQVSPPTPNRAEWQIMSAEVQTLSVVVGTRCRVCCLGQLGICDKL